MFKPPGKTDDFEDLTIAEMDDDFFHFTSYMDEQIIAKIERGAYVVLDKLLPREKIPHDNGMMQMVEKEGLSYLQPVADKNPPAVTDLKKWQQAFQIYATIYTGKHPDRSAEVFKYIYNIEQLQLFLCATMSIDMMRLLGDS